MKKLFFFAFALVALSISLFVACQKDNEIKTSNELSTTQNEVADRTGPSILGTVTTNCFCGSRSCNVTSPSTLKRNAIRIAVNNVTHAYYNVNGPGITYNIYQGSCATTPIATFNCSLANVTYASPLLANNTTYYVRMNVGLSTSPCYAITTGGCLGQQCNPQGD